MDDRKPSGNNQILKEKMKIGISIVLLIVGFRAFHMTTAMICHTSSIVEIVKVNFAIHIMVVEL